MGNDDYVDGQKGKIWSGHGSKSYRDWQRGYNEIRGATRPDLTNKRKNNSADGGPAGVIALVGMVATAAFLWTIRNEAAIAATGLAVGALADKLARDQKASTGFRIAAAAVTGLLTAAAVYKVATTHNIPEGTVISEYWKNRGVLLMGAGALGTGYIALRDWSDRKIDELTVIKGIVGGALFVAGVWMNTSGANTPQRTNAPSGAQYATVNAEKLNVRSCPSTACSSVAQLSYGDPVALTKYAGSQWWQITCPTPSRVSACYARARDDRGNVLISSGPR